MPTPLRFFYDYVDPGSYLIERMLGELAERSGLEMERLPFETTPPPAPLVDPRGEAWRRSWEEARPAAAEAGITLAQPRLIPWTRKAHELALHAREHGRFEDVHRALFHTFLVDGKDLGRVDVLLEVATAHGLDLTATKAVLDVDRHTEGVATARVDAERLGVLGVPTLLANHGSLEGFRGRSATLAFLEAAVR
ncbi:MAG: DsbA family oxidoreductase [Gemmatimonadetes bacterium]|nr:DsbA family oxidoreductase [Gemmatimonadota bacterium]